MRTKCKQTTELPKKKKKKEEEETNKQTKQKTDVF